MSTKSKRSDAQHVDLMRDAMEKHRLSITDLADRIGITRSYASLVYHEKRSPSPKLMRALERLVRMPSVFDLDENTNRHIVNDNLTYRSLSAKKEYSAMSKEDLEKAIVDYARELPKDNGSKKIITLTVLRDLTIALLGKNGSYL